MAASATGGAVISRIGPIASVDGGGPRQNRAPKAFVNVYISFLCSSRDSTFSVLVKNKLADDKYSIT
jgi:hypothetical protein